MDVEAVIEELYEAFADVPKPKQIIGCPCCTDQDELDRLNAADLRTASADVLKSHASSWLLTVGSEADFRFYLPRFLEIMICDPEFQYMPEPFAAKISQSGFQTWSKRKQNAVEAAFKAMLTIAAREERTYDIEGWVTSLAKSDLPLEPYFAILDSEMTPETWNELQSENSESHALGKMTGAWWDYDGIGEPNHPSPERNGAVFNWLFGAK